MPNVEILYSKIPVHSKIYFWREGENITNALIGSANFSVSGLRNDYKEVLSDVDEDSFADFQAYYEKYQKYQEPRYNSNLYCVMVFAGPLFLIEMGLFQQNLALIGDVVEVMCQKVTHIFESRWIM